MTQCLFCKSSGPFSTVEHVIPESLGNDDLLLRGEVCDKCQAYFGREVEKYVLEKTPIAFWRTFLGIRTKRGKLPAVELSQPNQQKGLLLRRHEAHDNGVGFAAHADGSTSIDIEDTQLVQQLLDGSRNSVQFVLTPKTLSLLARFLMKVGIELLCTTDRELAHSAAFDAARKYARNATDGFLWPIFHSTVGDVSDLRREIVENGEAVEEVSCYSYQLFEFRSYYIFEFRVGTDVWVLTLNNRYPATDLAEAFPSRRLELIWYPDVP